MDQDCGSGDMIDLISSFSCLGTNNKDDLVRQFLTFVAVDPTDASFYLEANNWNLQLALNAFMDFQTVNEYQGAEAQMNNVDSGTASIGEYKIGEDILELVDMLPSGPISIAPNTQFHVGWQLRNITQFKLPAGTQIVRTNGTFLGREQACLFVNELEPGGLKEVSVELISPPAPGNFRTVWHVLAPDGGLYGQNIFTDLIVMDTVQEMCLYSSVADIVDVDRKAERPKNIEENQNQTSTQD